MIRFILALLACICTASAASAQVPALGINGGYMFYPYGPQNQIDVHDVTLGYEYFTTFFVPAPVNPSDPTDAPGYNSFGQPYAYDTIISAPGVQLIRQYVFSYDYDYFSYVATMWDGTGSIMTRRIYCCFAADDEIHDVVVDFDSGDSGNQPEIFLAIDGNYYGFYDSGSTDNGNPYFISWVAGPTSFFLDPYTISINPNRVVDNTAVYGTEMRLFYVNASDQAAYFNQNGTLICVSTDGYPADFIANYNGVCGPLTASQVQGSQGFYDANW